MKVLVTGGAGFIGANYVYAHQELRPQDELWVLDALTYAGDHAYLKEAEDKGLHFVEGRIEDREAVYKLFERERFDAVIHFAAESHVDRSIADSEVFIKTNVMGTHVLLDASRDTNVGRFHHISTDEVYGDTPIDSDEQFHEDSILKPSSAYSASKAGSDLLCLSYHRTFGLPVTLSRCSNNYGPFQHSEKFIAQTILNALQDKPIPVYGTGMNVRDWLYVEDHCKAVIDILERGRVGQIYNIGADNECHNLDVVKLILKLMGKPESLIQFVEDRKGHDLRYSNNFDKLHQELGWAPTVDFETGLRRSIAWFELQPHERSYSRWRNRI